MSSTKTAVISCAGIGSRLGLGKTKSLIDIGGKSILRRQLEMLKNIEDIRIVIGYQANAVIEEALQVREDIIFVYNHRYFETKTGSSLYLGSRNTKNEYILGIDGDMLIHPDDMQMCINADFEFVGYSDIASSETVYVSIDNEDNVTKFSSTCGEFEWTGPMCLKKEKIKNMNDNIYAQIEPFLPLKGLKVRAQDLDTYEDFIKAEIFIRNNFKY